MHRTPRNSEARYCTSWMFPRAIRVGLDAWLAGAVLGLLGLGLPAESHARSNFLVVVADDVGVDGINIYSRDDLYGHLGEGGNPGPTPTLDSLAEEGILFRHAYTNPQCAPTRAQALTGRFAFRTGIGTPGGADLDLAETTLPERLSATHLNAAVGKWHIGPNGDVDHPIDSGFSRYDGPLSNLSDYTDWAKTTNSTSTTGTTQTGTSTYVTTDNVDEAIDRISEFGAAPWFLWLAFTAPHAPFHVPPSTLTTIAVDASSDNPTKWKAAIEAMDTEIQRLLDNIPADVLADTTIVFIGDNGTPRQAAESPFDPNRAKGTVYEGGINVPLIIRSPEIDPSDEGSESLARVSSTDLFATLAEIAGVHSDADHSISLLPYLQDPDLPTLPARPFTYAERFTPNGGGPYTEEERAILDDRYKLIWRDGAPEEFYDLEADAFESDNLLVSGMDAAETAAYSTLLAALLKIQNPLCSDGIDNDQDGLHDQDGAGLSAADGGCSDASDALETDPTVVCDDGVDNDNDGAIDYPNDSACVAPLWVVEDSQCSDGIDNDGDGDIDLDDSACVGNPANLFERTRCSDGIDNDQDGAIDAGEDPECLALSQISETNPNCGLGFESALGVVALLALRRRRRARPRN